MSNRLIDILEDDKKMTDLQDDTAYLKSVGPRLEKLQTLIWHENIPGITNDEQEKDLDFIKTLRNELHDNPQSRLLPLEMTQCNKLWKKYKGKK
jgi:hypothetical protein